MQITINVPDQHIHGALAAPASRAWADEAGWDPEKVEGFMVDASGTIYELDATELSKALVLMADRYPLPFANLQAGQYDGSIGDLLLQLMAFGEAVYG